MRRKERYLFYKRKRRSRWWLVLLLFVLLVSGISLYLNSVANRNPQKENIKLTVPTLPMNLEGVKFLHISDLHGKFFGDNHELIMDKLVDDNYKAVLLTGDMIGKDGDDTAFLRLISRFPEDMPVLFIAGDEDPPVFDTERGTYSSWILKARDLGAVFLDAPYSLIINKTKLWFMPLESAEVSLDDRAYALAQRRETVEQMPGGSEKVAAQNVLQLREDALNRCREAALTMLSSDCYIALSHLPIGDETAVTIQGTKDEQESMLNYPGFLQVVFSGHLNNGQVVIPWRGSLWAPQTPLHEGGFLGKGVKLSGSLPARGIAQHVSKGMGVCGLYPWWLSYRLFNPPTFSLVQLTVQMQ